MHRLVNWGGKLFERDLRRSEQGWSGGKDCQGGWINWTMCGMLHPTEEAVLLSE